MGDVESFWLVRPPTPPLRPYIDGYVGYRQVGFPPGIHRGLPSRHLTCIVSIGDAIDVAAQTDRHQAPARYRFVVSGLQAAAALIAHRGNQEGVAIELTPLGCRALFDVPARTLWDTSLEAQEVMGLAAEEFWERLQGTTGWEARLAACDHVLGRLLLGGARAPHRDVTAAWELLVASGGRLSVADLAAQVGWSRQHLRSRFADEFGLSPKLAARVIRFERARRMLQQPPRPAIVDVAAACGYYDQAHLNRDFAMLAGCSPGRWLREELPSFQDPNANGTAGSAA
jgi:AraC-like DNA-binding protein